jgi:hypothetical protein
MGACHQAKVLDVTCVIPLSREASDSTKAFVRRLDHKTLEEADAGGASLLLPGGERPNNWGDDYISCLYDPWEDVVDCEGSRCTAWATLRADDFTRIANSSTFYCPNGCVIMSFSWYWCDTGGGNGDNGDIDWGTGGGSSSGGGTTGPPVGDLDSESEASKPNCSQNQTDPIAIAYCKGHEPNSSELAVINTVLERMRGRGSVCTDLADAASQLITDHGFRVWHYTNEDFGGGAPRNGDWVVISDGWIEGWASEAKDSRGLNLEAILAHEMDHHLDHHSSETNIKGHLVQNGVEIKAHTLNSRQCSGSNI